MFLTIIAKIVSKVNSHTNFPIKPKLSPLVLEKSKLANAVFSLAKKFP